METTTQDRIERTFPVTAPAELSLTTVSGRVTVRSGDQPEVAVQAEKHGSEEARENTRIDIDNSGNRVSVHTRQERESSGAARLASVTYDITVPRDCRVQVKAVSADVDVEGVRGQVQLQTVSGEVTVSSVSGDISLTTVSGELSVRDVEGSLALHTTSGDGEITGSTLRGFNVDTVSGDLSVQTPLIQGEHYHINTVSGDLRLILPAGTGATIQMKSVSGEVASNIPGAEIIRSGRRHWQGRINGGGANVEMHSVSGDLCLDADSGSAKQPDAPMGEEAGGVLRLLEQGEIDVEQALSRLRGTGE